jgi:hypothetical protein
MSAGRQINHTKGTMDGLDKSIIQREVLVGWREFRVVARFVRYLPPLTLRPIPFPDV